MVQCVDVVIVLPGTGCLLGSHDCNIHIRESLGSRQAAPGYPIRQFKAVLPRSREFTGPAFHKRFISVGLVSWSSRLWFRVWRPTGRPWVQFVGVPGHGLVCRAFT